VQDAPAADSSKPVFVVDGTAFSDLDGFARQFSTYLKDHVWNGNLDAFNDILRGGFGTPEGGFVLRWLASDQSRHDLGAVWSTLVEIIRTHGPGGAEAEDGVELELR
jgi:RNAse (barnase) inhibitor barstar